MTEIGQGVSYRQTSLATWWMMATIGTFPTKRGQRNGLVFTQSTTRSYWPSPSRRQ